MRLIVTVYDALRTFDRPCTRAELEQATGLDKDAVHLGLRGLRRRKALLTYGEERERAVYRLKPSARRPEDMRGGAHPTRHKASAPNLKVSIIVLDTAASPALGHQASMPGSHRAEPGALRHERPSVPAVGSCLLANVWRKR